MRITSQRKTKTTVRNLSEESEMKERLKNAKKDKFIKILNPDGTVQRIIKI